MKIRILLLTMLISAKVCSAQSWLADTAPVYNLTLIQTGDRTRTKLHSPGLNIAFTAEKMWGPAFRMTVFTPVSGTSGTWDPDRDTLINNRRTAIWDFYNTPLGFDLMAGINAPFLSGFAVGAEEQMYFDGALGVHMNGVFLSHTQHSNRRFNSLTMGFAADMRGSVQVAPSSFAGAMLSIHCDFLDLLHSGNKMEMFFGMNAGLFFRRRF